MKKAKILKEILESRRSIFPKNYTDEEIDEDVLHEILNSAIFSPNHKMTKPWRLIVFRK